MGLSSGLYGGKNNSVSPLRCWFNHGFSLIQDLESDFSREREVAIHTLARRSLPPEELEKVRALRDDPKGRPWVRMAALDTLMEIEREKDAQARE